MTPRRRKEVRDRPAISETYALTQAIEAIKRAVKRPGSLPDGTLEDLKEAVFHLSELRYQAKLGIHRNPARRRRGYVPVRFSVKEHLDPLERAGRRMRLSRSSQDLRHRLRGGRFRRGNPILATLGANPPDIPKPIMARWAKIEYERTDDPEGVDIVRVHEFSDGFIAKALPDGSVILRHPQHALWTKR